jgi:hypothetical protein
MEARLGTHLDFISVLLLEVSADFWFLEQLVFLHFIRDARHRLLLLLVVLVHCNETKSLVKYDLIFYPPVMYLIRNSEKCETVRG